MKRKLLWLNLLLAGACSLNAFALTPKAESVSGKVVLVKPKAGHFFLAYRRPGASLDTLATFKVDGETLFVGLPGIESMKLNDAVRVEYVEEEGGSWAARRVEKSEK
ncbi:MAG: hypothetical protein HY714_04230 [Candidatus Omnitrophica bacterium]|nr:hypothetical protein [Candidatus Omnitrophota bacterium]